MLQMKKWQNILPVMLTLFLYFQWGPANNERERWGIASGSPFVREVALTFDDGPRDKGTPPLIAVLEEHSAPGTFFLVGKFAERYASITKELQHAGHEIENHSYTHPKLYTLWVEKIVREIERCNEVMLDLDISKPRYMRPPGGGYNIKIFNALRRLNMRLALWNLNTGDYNGKSSDEIERFVLKNVRPGSVILMHSGVPATIQALHRIIPELRKRGYRFVTLLDLQNGGLI